MDKELLKRIQAAIENEFPIFRSALNNLETKLLSQPATLVIEDNTPSVIPDFWQKMPLLKKVMAAPLAPVLLIGFVGRLPYVGYKKYKWCSDFKPMSGDYKKANCDAEKASVCTKYAQDIFNKITNRVAFEDTFQEYMKHHSELLDNQEKQQKSKIEDEKRLLEQLKADFRDAETVKRLYEPLNNRVKMMDRHLRYFLTLHFPNRTTDLPCITANNVRVTNTVICSGIAAEIRLGEGTFIIHDRATHQAEARELGQICVRLQKKRVKEADIDQYRDILKDYR